MKRLFLLLFLLIFNSCEKKQNYPKVLIQKKENIIKVNSERMIHVFGNYPIALNVKGDTIITDFMNYKSLDSNYVQNSNLKKKLPKYNFKIIIDTTNTITTKGFEYKSCNLPDKEFVIVDGLINGKTPNKEGVKKSTDLTNIYAKNTFKSWHDYVECYPLLIQNISKNTVFLKEIKFIQEAKDVDNKWKPIEFFDNHSSSSKSMVFSKQFANSFSISSIIKYNGNFKTKIRVKVKINQYYYYSNEFVGNINKSQFNQNYVFNYFDFWKPYFDKKIILNTVFLKD